MSKLSFLPKGRSLLPEGSMQNKPNLLNTKMNVNKVLTKGCKDSRLRGSTQNKPNLSRRSLWRSRIKPNYSYLYHLKAGLFQESVLLSFC